MSKQRLWTQVWKKIWTSKVARMSKFELVFETTDAGTEVYVDLHFVSSSQLDSSSWVRNSQNYSFNGKPLFILDSIYINNDPLFASQLTREQHAHLWSDTYNILRWETSWMNHSGFDRQTASHFFVNKTRCWQEISMLLQSMLSKQAIN